MKSIIDKVSSFLTFHTFWIYLTLILFLSFHQTMTVLDDQRENVVYLSIEKWFLYGQFALCTSLLFSPVLLFTGFRNWLNKNLKNPFIAILWTYAFIVHPGIMGSIAIDMNFISSHDGTVIWIAALVFCFVEIMIKSNNYLIKRFNFSQWLISTSIEKLVVIFLISLSFLYVCSSIPSSILDFFSEFIQVLTLISLFYLFYYVNHYILFARLYRVKGIVYYGSALILSIILFYPLVAFLVASLPVFAKYVHHLDGNFWVPSSEAPTSFEGIKYLLPVPGMLLSIPLILVVEWLSQGRRISQLETEKSETELSLLRQQLNPHFFFNTLNNLYALSITKDEKTPEVILKLSQLMRYVIEKGKEIHVPIQEEIQYIEDYVELQSIRLSKRLEYVFDQDISAKDVLLPPLLLIVFVENAFKHGIEIAEDKGFLRLTLTCHQNTLEFECENSCEEVHHDKIGTGLQNLKRRLELLYPSTHELEVNQLKVSYKARLKISIN